MIYRFGHPKEIIKPEELIRHRMTYLILKAAYDRGIDCQTLVRHTPSGKRVVYLCFNKDGKNIWVSPQNNFFNRKVSCSLSVYKNMTHQALEAAGIPVPEQLEIKNIEQLEKIKIPAPWVIKPVFEYGGKDVVVGIKNKKSLVQTAAELFKKYHSLLIEEFIEGNDFRLLVLSDSFLGAVKRVPAQIKGDGVSTIKELIEHGNQCERKKIADAPATYLKPIPINRETEDCLEKQGLNFDSVLPKDKIVAVRKNANVSTGGEAHDVTDEVHPDNVELAKKAIRTIGLDIGGVDFITKDIAQPIKENGGRVTEINSLPSLWIHRFPNVGKERNVADKILDYILESM